MRLRRVTRVLVLLVLGGLTLPGSHCHHHHNNSSAKNGAPGHTAPPATTGPPAQSQATPYTQTTFPPCGGGTGVPRLGNGGYPQSATESALSNAIINYRISLGLSALGVGNGNGEGVAQWHAQDMANNDYVGLVGSDGEDVLQRFACTGGGPSTGGAIAVGQSTSVNAVMAYLQSNPAANGIITSTGPPGPNTVNVGYNNGFWMILLH